MADAAGRTLVPGHRSVRVTRNLTQEEGMSVLTNFFQESDTQLGVFYPNHYLIAVFRKLETAQQAVKKLRLAGFAEYAVIAVTGQDFIELAKEETGLGSFLMQALSRFFATEQMSHDSDLDLAQHGAAFGSALPDRKD
jgi:hypothetical protein